MPGRDSPNADALLDFDHKFLSARVVPAHDKGGGFLYLHLPESKDLSGYLADAKVYIPEVYRHDTGNKLIFFEVDLKPALSAGPAK